jgi:deoxyadenosine/deoxycytidine kinase
VGKLISVVGNTGVGKTTLAQAICRHTGFTCSAEKHEGTPFQELFSTDHEKYALANQFDFMLRRADQEVAIRRTGEIGVQDGGLDQDFHIFTRLFYQKGYLTQAKFELCARLYQTLRACLAEPELYVWLKAPIEVVKERFEERQRRLSIAQMEDMQAIEQLLNRWLGGLDPGRILVLESGEPDQDYEDSLLKITRWLKP